MQNSLYKIYQSYFSFYDSFGAALFTLKSKDLKAGWRTIHFYIGYFLFHFIFTTARFIHYVVNQDKIYVTTFVNLVWVLYGCFGIVAYFSATFHRNNVNEFLTSWSLVEAGILQGE
ncbi:unnamed protein product [Allacma fusca]|uniref:Uncharacterized protein n=1 Tax=Allacma fusca TaxID=39272 RepID=A0A8J2KKK0_9HEXA|nr:unnamed protein product [Allacma fusca]